MRDCWGCLMRMRGADRDPALVDTRPGRFGTMMLQPAVEPVAPDLLRSLREHVHERLRRAIVAGRFRNGERLNERQLAAPVGLAVLPGQFGVGFSR